MSIASRSYGGAKRVVSWYRPSTWRARGWLWRIAVIVFTLVVINCVLMIWWSREPAQIDVNKAAIEYLPEGTKPVVGSATVGTTAAIIHTLLHKHGGYISNDRLPPGVLMDNMPNWEYGVLTNLRETSQSMRNDFSRSQSQSAQAPMLERADNQLRINSKNWMFPSAESQYGKAQDNFVRYARELTDDNPNNAQFYARADNLNSYLDLVSKSLGDIAQRLSASVGDLLVSQELQQTGVATAKAQPVVRKHKTPWLQIDDNFYYARGYSWALLQELRAIRVDFNAALRKKNAMASLDQIINELEKTQGQIWSPMILNGRGFGFTANHSLVMASYISRANAAIIDLQNLLRNG